MRYDVSSSLTLPILIAVVLSSGAVLHAAAPVVTNVTPSRGPAAGGTAVVLSGTGFTGATQVSFGATFATSFIVVNDTTIQAITPAGVVGVVDVSVTGPDGTDTFEEGFGYGNIPVALADSYSTPFNTSLTVTSPGVLSNDDPNAGGGVVIELGANVTNGALSLTPDGGFTYTPNATFAGTDRFTYRSRNQFGPSNFAAVTIAVGTPAGPLPPSALQVVNVAGSTVTMRWTPPQIGPAPTAYLIEGGSTPGSVEASIVAPATPVFTFTAPTGSFFVRARSIAGGEQSAPSNEVPLFVNVPVVPSAPQSLLALVNDTTVALSWHNTFGGGAPVNLVLDVSGALTTSIPLGVTDSFSAAGVPAGTYTLALRAVNVIGSSAATEPVTITVPAPCSGVPGEPANLVAYRVGSTINVLWDAPTTGAAPTGYVLNVSGAFVGSFATPTRSMSGTVGPGTYVFSVTAINPCGGSAATPTQSVTVP
jgi:hypothetical protein